MRTIPLWSTPAVSIIALLTVGGFVTYSRHTHELLYLCISKIVTLISVCYFVILSVNAPLHTSYIFFSTNWLSPTKLKSVVQSWQATFVVITILMIVWFLLSVYSSHPGLVMFYTSRSVIRRETQSHLSVHFFLSFFKLLSDASSLSGSPLTCSFVVAVVSFVFTLVHIRNRGKSCSSLSPCVCQLNLWSVSTKCQCRKTASCSCKV